MGLNAATSRTGNSGRQSGPGAGRLFIHAEDDGWPARMLVQRIGGVSVRFVLVATLGRRPYLEESIYPFAERFNRNRLRGLERGLVAHLLMRQRGPRAAAFAVGGSEGRSLVFLWGSVQYCWAQLKRRSRS